MENYPFYPFLPGVLISIKALMTKLHILFCEIFSLTRYAVASQLNCFRDRSLHMTKGYLYV